MSVYPSFACVLDDQPLFTFAGEPDAGVSRRAQPVMRFPRPD